MSVIKPILGLEDAFGGRALALRRLQFRLFEIYTSAGFSEVIPPLVERPEALSSGSGRFLADQTVFLITGSSGNTREGQLVTFSGGARG